MLSQVKIENRDQIKIVISRIQNEKLQIFFMHILACKSALFYLLSFINSYINNIKYIAINTLNLFLNFVFSYLKLEKVKFF